MISTTQDISKNTFLWQYFHLPAPSPHPEDPFCSVPQSSIRTPAYPPHENRHFFQSPSSPLFNWLVCFFIPSLLSGGPVFRELISPCQPTSDHTTNSHTVGHRLLVCSQTCIGIAQAADTDVNVLSGIKNRAERSLRDMKCNNLSASAKRKSAVMKNTF